MPGSMSSTGRGSHSGPRSSEIERIVAAADVDTTFAGKKNVKYRGRRSTWPGALGLFILLVGSVAGLTYYGIQKHNDIRTESTDSSAAVEATYTSGDWIDDGGVEDATTDLSVTNPKTYTDKGCEQPNYISKDGRIFAELSSGTTQIDIKGVNWKGMQDSNGVPQGLWDNTLNGDTLYRFGYFLKKNKFNVVRLPLSIDSVLRNVEIETNMINTNSNRALASASRYNTLLGLIVQGLGQFNIGVVLDFDVLSTTETDDTGLWYGTSIQLADIKSAISNLSDAMCDSKHFNIIGIDLKDSLSTDATWGDGSDTDWSVAATELGNHLVSECSNWLAFVQGVEGDSHKDTYGSRSIKNTFLPGSDLTGVYDNPIKLDTDNKVVYSPHYYSSSYLPRLFFFDSGTTNGDMLDDYVELSDADLLTNVQLNMNYSFGAAMDSGMATVLSTFGGLVGDADKTTSKTSQRIIEDVITRMTATTGQFLAGGFFYNLNPDTYWPYPAPDDDNQTTQGLVDDTWRAANMDVLDVLKAMNDMPSLEFIPCVTS